MSILQGFSKTLVAEVYIEIHMLQTKEFACARQVKTVKDIALQNKQKGRIVTILSMHLFVGMAVYFISLMYVTFFCLMKHEILRTCVLISQFSTKIYAVDFRLFLKNCCKLFLGYFFKNSFGYWHIFTWLLKLTILDVYIRPWLLRDDSNGC